MKTIVLLLVLDLVFIIWHVLIAPSEQEILEGNIPSISDRLKRKLKL